MRQSSLASIATFALGGLLAACSNTTTFTDASTGDDVEIDANTELDARPSGTVTVTTHTRNGAPAGVVAGVEVLVVGPDGTVGDTAQTDANGQATLDVTSGDSVTAIYDLAADNDVYLTTFVAVKPGDDLTFGDFQAPATTGAQTGSMTLNWPASAVPDYYYLHTSCGYQYIPNTTGTATTAVVPQYDYCTVTPFSALLLGWDNTSTYLLEVWSVLVDEPFVDQGTATMLPAPTPVGAFDVNLTGISAEVDQYEVNISSVIDGAAAYNGYVSADVAAGAISGVLSFSAAVDAVSVYSYLSRDGNFDSQNVSERLAPGVTSITTPSVPLPWVSSDVIAVVPARTIQWFTLGTELYDGALVSFYWSTGGIKAQGAGLGSGASTDYLWTIIIPPGLTALQFPELPAALAAYAPTEDTSIYPNIQLFESTGLADYDAVRGLAEWELTCIDCTPLGAATYPTVRTSGQSGGVPSKRHQGRRANRGQPVRPGMHSGAVR